MAPDQDILPQMCLRNWLDRGSPLRISFLIRVQPIDPKQIAVGLAISTENRVTHINERQSRVGRCMRFDQAIRFADNRPVFPTRTLHNWHIAPTLDLAAIRAALRTPTPTARAAVPVPA